MSEVSNAMAAWLAPARASLPHRCPLRPSVTPGGLADLLRILGADLCASASAPDLEIPIWRASSGAALFREGSHPTHLFVVRSGTFKIFRTTEDGYEQVRAFMGQGDVIGFEAFCDDAESLDAVALEDATVYALPLRELDAWRHQSPELDHALQRALSSQLVQTGRQLELMAPVAAEVKLARFLIGMSERMAARGQSPRRFLLRMSRRDIASLLGVAHETVSRSFGALADGGLVSVDRREVSILDHQGLLACTRSTRRPLEIPAVRPRVSMSLAHSFVEEGALA